MTLEDIKEAILENVKTDIYEDLYGVDRASEIIFDMFTNELDRKTSEAALNLSKTIDCGWEDRMGGQFTTAELLEAQRNDW